VEAKPLSGIRIRIRGIYASALTRLLWNLGGTIVDPSPVLQALGFPPVEGPEDVAIHDRLGKDGVRISGEPEAVESVVTALREVLPHALFRELQRGLSLGELKGQTLSLEEFRRIGQSLVRKVEVIFPAPAQEVLDRIRAEIRPTVPGHHHLKCIDAQAVDSAEEGGGVLEEKASRLWEDLVYCHYEKGKLLSVEHAKPDGRAYRYRGTIVHFEPGKVVLERTFQPGGRYDALDVPKEQGDWGTAEFRQDVWHTVLSYYARDGALKGRIYNINTPPQFFPDSIRYYDLEVDVVVWPEGRVAVVDQELLEEHWRKGIVTTALRDRAREEVETLLSHLEGGPRVSFRLEQ
jgi:protein associated with RNAse G/E